MVPRGHFLVWFSLHYVPLPFLSQRISVGTSVYDPHIPKMTFCGFYCMFIVIGFCEKWAITSFLWSLCLEPTDTAFCHWKTEQLIKSVVSPVCVRAFVHVRAHKYTRTFIQNISDHYQYWYQYDSTITHPRTVLPLLQCWVICVITDNSNLVWQAWRNSSHVFRPRLAPFISEGASVWFPFGQYRSVKGIGQGHFHRGGFQVAD